MAANTLSHHPSTISEKDRQEMQGLYQSLCAAEARIIGSNGEAQALPPSLHAFLTAVVETLKRGNPVTILQSSASLTTSEAARLLGMSRQFLIKLLDKGEIPHHFVGTHRRLYARDVFAYKAVRDTARRKILDDLARAEYDEGIYDRFPDDAKPAH